MGWQELMGLLGMRQPTTDVQMGQATVYDPRGRDVTNVDLGPTGGMSVGQSQVFRNGEDVTNSILKPWGRVVPTKFGTVGRNTGWTAGDGGRSESPIDPWAPIAFTVER